MFEAKDREGHLIWSDPSINITAREVLDRSLLKIGLVEGFMRDECKLLFVSDSMR